MSPGIYDQDHDIDWLRQDGDQVTISKIDAAEAWSPPPNPPSGEVADGGAAVTDSGAEPAAAAVAADPVAAERDAFDDAVARSRFNDDVAAIEATITLEPEPTSIEEGLALLRALSFAMDNLALLKRDVVTFLADVMSTGTTDVEGYGAVTVSDSLTYQAWDHDGLRPRIVRQIAASWDGDVSMVEGVIEHWLRFAGLPSRYSAPALKAIGLAPDEYAKPNVRRDVRIQKDRR